MCKYVFTCPCNLKHGINIDERFLGKRIPINILEHSGFVLFPIPKCNEEYGFELINPNIDNIIGEYICGDYSQSLRPSTKAILHPRITKVYLTLKIDEDLKDEYKFSQRVTQEIERLANKFIKCISIIHPSAVRWSYSKEAAYIEPIDRFSLINTVTNEDEGLAASLYFRFTNPSEEVSIEEFFKIYRNINRIISFQHSLLADTERCLARGEYREVVLNCATIIEKTLKEEIISYLDKEQTGENIKKQILKHANGYNKTRKLLEDFKITIDIDYNKISTGTIDIRNKVIHGGYFPTREEVVQAIKDAKLVIREHNVQIFSDKTP